MIDYEKVVDEVFNPKREAIVNSIADYAETVSAVLVNRCMEVLEAAGAEAANEVFVLGVRTLIADVEALGLEGFYRAKENAETFGISPAGQGFVDGTALPKLPD